MATTTNISKAAAADSRQGHSGPTELLYELEEALWRAGPLEEARLPVQQPTTNHPRTFAAPTAAVEGAGWLELAEAATSKERGLVDVHLAQVLDLTRRSMPVITATTDQEPVFVYKGHALFRGELHIAPGLFLPAEGLVLTAVGTYLHLYVQGKWIGAAIPLAYASVCAIEYWLGTAWEWLPALRKQVLGEAYDAASETLDRQGRLVGARIGPARRGPGC